MKRKIVVGAFLQETNVFNPVISDRAFYSLFHPRGETFLLGSELLTLRGAGESFDGILQVLDETGAEIVPTAYLRSQSGGKTDHAVVEEFLQYVRDALRAAGHVDGVFLMLHGATQTTQVDDGCGYILEAIRREIGPDVVLAAALDLHANVTGRMFRAADALCGYRKYPHTDMPETGRRAAELGLSAMERPLKKRAVSVPLILPASAYNTTRGPVAGLMERAARRAQELGLAEYSIFQMQPWLDVEEGGSAILAYGDNDAALDAFVREFAGEELALAQKVTLHLTPLDEAIREALNNRTGKPFVLCDAADSPGAGAVGDHAGVLREVLRVAPQLRFAFALTDPAAVEQAERLGEGAEGEFVLGGCQSGPEAQVRVRARVDRLTDGTFRCQGAEWRGKVRRIGRTAALAIGPVRVVVCRQLTGNNDPGFYESHGILMAGTQLVNVKVCTSFRAAYEPISARIYEVDTPGAAGLDLRRLPYVRLPRPFFPLDPVTGSDVREL